MFQDFVLFVIFVVKNVFVTFVAFVVRTRRQGHDDELATKGTKVTKVKVTKVKITKSHNVFLGVLTTTTRMEE